MKFNVDRSTLILFLLVVSTGLYINTLRNEFIYDDIKLLVHNPLSKTFDIKKIFSTDFFYPDRCGSYRPITILSYSINYFMSGNTLNTTIYHSFNLLINGLNVMIVFLIVEAITKNVKLSFLTALLFAVHPIHTEAVATVFGRADLLYMFFIFIPFFLHIKNYSSSRLNPIIVYFLSLLMFLIATLSKETAVALLGFIILYDLTFKYRIKNKKDLVRNIWKSKAKYLGYVVVIVIWLSLRIIFKIGPIPRGASLIDNPLINASISERVFTGIKLLGIYLYKLLFPVVLSVDYSYNQVPVSSSIDFQVILSMILLTFLSIALYFSFKRNKLVFFSLGFLVISLIPVLNIIMLIGSIMAERYLYVPSFGFVLLIAIIIQSIKIKHLKTFFIIVLVLLYSIRTVMRVGDFKDDLTLWQKTVKTSPLSVKAHHNLGVSYLDKNDYDMAIGELNKSLAIYPPYPDAINSLGVAYGMKGDYKTAVGIFQKGLQLFPNHERMKYNLAIALEFLKKERSE